MADEFVTADGEMIDAAELADRYAHMRNERRRVREEAMCLNDELQYLTDAIEQMESMLLTSMAVGDVIRLPGGRTVVCKPGKRRNATVNRAACEEHLEALEDVGLVERVQPPTPPPVIRYGTVSAIRAAAIDLALRGVRADELVNEGSPGDPELTIVEDDR